MKAHKLAYVLCSFIAAGLIVGSIKSAHAASLETVATSPDTLWNGVAVTPAGRIFVSLPNWLGPSAGVGEIGSDGKLRPWPGTEWNRWRADGNAATSFVSVNAIRLSPKGDELWVVDSGAPLGGTQLPGGAKLVAFDVQTGAAKKVYPLGEVLGEAKAAPNDMRFAGDHVIISEHGVGSIIVVDLGSGRARRVLVRHPLLVLDPNRPVRIEGEVLKAPNGKPFGTNANQLEVSPDGRWLYIQPLNGGMARIETALLTDESASPERLAEGLEFWVDTPPLSGTAIDAEGNLYLNSINDRSIRKLTPDGVMETLITDPSLRWADAPWLTDDGFLWVPVAQLGWTPMLNGGVSKIEWPTPLLRLRVR
jgi:sugar lactone lactonase YvrE